MPIIVKNLPRRGVYLYMFCPFGRDSEPLRPVKIGITDNVRTRLASVQTGSHVRLEALAVFNTPNRDIARRMEGSLHQLYAEHRLEGEWFSIDPVEALERVCAELRGYFAHCASESGPGGLTADELSDAVGLPLFERDAKVYRAWRDHYARTSNVKPIG